MLSDAVLEELLINNQQQLKALARTLIEQALDGDSTAMKNVMVLVQGRPPQAKGVSVDPRAQEIEDGVELIPAASHKPSSATKSNGGELMATSNELLSKLTSKAGE